MSGKPVIAPVKYRAGYRYQLAEDYTQQVAIYPPADIVTPWITLTTTGALTTRAGYAWNGANKPAINTKNLIRATLAHDPLYQLMNMRLLDCGWRPTADAELQRIAIEDRMWHIRAWWVLRGVRLGGEGAAAWQDEPVLTAP